MKYFTVLIDYNKYTYKMIIDICLKKDDLITLAKGGHLFFIEILLA
jgi:hypothetical protein